jgi:hypothetical protein
MLALPFRLLAKDSSASVSLESLAAASCPVRFPHNGKLHWNSNFKIPSATWLIVVNVLRPGVSVFFHFENPLALLNIRSSDVPGTPRKLAIAQKRNCLNLRNFGEFVL